MSVANFNYQQTRYFTASGAVPAILAGGVAANSAADAVSAPLIMNLVPAVESAVTLTPGTYTLFAETFVSINDAQTACQKMELCLHEVVGGVFDANPRRIGPSYTGAVLVGAAMTIANVQIQLELSDSIFPVTTPRTFVIRINYNGMPAAVDSTATFSTLSFIKISDDPSLAQLSFKT
jgi:hypothetical protein